MRIKLLKGSQPFIEEDYVLDISFEEFSKAQGMGGGITIESKYLPHPVQHRQHKYYFYPSDLELMPEIRKTPDEIEPPTQIPWLEDLTKGFEPSKEIPAIATRTVMINEYDYEVAYEDRKAGVNNPLTVLIMSGHFNVFIYRRKGVGSGHMEVDLEKFMGDEGCW